jgi:hypothetical protein
MTTVVIRQAVNQSARPIQVTGKGAKFLHRLCVPIRWHTHPMLFGPHIDAGGMGMDDGHMFESGLVLLAFFGHMFLQSEAE